MSAAREAGHPLRWIVGAAAIVVVIAWTAVAWWSRPPASDEIAVPGPPRVETKRTERIVTTSTQLPTASQTRPIPAIDPTLREAFSTSRNYRAFIAAAKQDVAHGGGAYALLAMQTCDYVFTILREIAKLPRPPAANSRDIMARVEARALLESRCATVDGPEFDQLALSRELRSRAGGNDPLYDLYLGVFSSKDRPDGRRQLVEAILEAQDPLPVARFSGLVQVSWPEKTAYFDGMVYRIDEEPALLAAAQLLVCSIGFDCTAANDTDVALVCLMVTLCEHDRFAIVKRQADAQGYSFDRVMEIHARMVDAFRHKRVDAFVQPT